MQSLADRPQKLLAPGEVDTVVGVSSVEGASTHGDDPAPSQEPKVVGDEALGLVDQFGKLPNLAVALGEMPQQLPPQRVSRKPQEGRRGGCTSRGRRHTW